MNGSTRFRRYRGRARNCENGCWESGETNCLKRVPDESARHSRGSGSLGKRKTGFPFFHGNDAGRSKHIANESSSTKLAKELARQSRNQKNRNISRKVIHVPISTTRRMKTSCSPFGATPINPPIAPFAKGGGPQDRGIFGSQSYFHKRRKGAKKKMFSSFAS